MTTSARLAALLACTVVVAGCSNPLGFDRNVRLVVTDLVVPESASAGTSFTVSLTAVSGGCVRFDRLIATRQTGTLTLEARGTDGGGRREAEIAVDQIRTISKVRLGRKLAPITDAKAGALRRLITEMYGE